MPISSFPSFPHPIDSVTVDNITSLRTVPGELDDGFIHLDAVGLAATTPFILVDLSDTTNWPHSDTDHILIDYLILETDPSTTFQGNLALGFLTAVDGTDGDFNQILEINMDQKADSLVETINFGAFGLHLQLDHWFGPTTANDTTWNTGASILGPDGNTFPAGTGDLVCLVTRTAGNLSYGITLGYSTRPA